MYEALSNSACAWWPAAAALPSPQMSQCVYFCTSKYKYKSTNGASECVQHARDMAICAAALPAPLMHEALSY